MLSRRTARCRFIQASDMAPRRCCDTEGYEYWRAKRKYLGETVAGAGCAAKPGAGATGAAGRGMWRRCRGLESAPEGCFLERLPLRQARLNIFDAARDMTWATHSLQTRKLPTCRGHPHGWLCGRSPLGVTTSSEPSSVSSVELTNRAA